MDEKTKNTVSNKELLVTPFETGVHGAGSSSTLLQTSTSTIFPQSSTTTTPGLSRKQLSPITNAIEQSSDDSNDEQHNSSMASFLEGESEEISFALMPPYHLIDVLLSEPDDSKSNDEDDSLDNPAIVDDDIDDLLNITNTYQTPLTTMGGISFYGATGFVDWIQKHPSTKHLVLVLPLDFLSDEFNLAISDRWPQWSDFGGGEDSNEGTHSIVPSSTVRKLFPETPLLELVNFLRSEHAKGQDSSDDSSDKSISGSDSSNYSSSASSSTTRFAESIIQSWSQSPVFLENLSTFYTVLHQRYAMTRQGMLIIEEWFNDGTFGLGPCPRYSCQGQSMLPYGEYAQPGKSRLQGFCPLCGEVYRTDSALDGALYGPSFAYFFLIAHWKGHALRSIAQQNGTTSSTTRLSSRNINTHSNLKRMPLLRVISGEMNKPRPFQPKIFGFRLASKSQ